MRRLLLLLLVVGGLAAFDSGGTFASFTASTTNGGSTFASGTIVLSNRVGTGTVCFSTTAITDSNANAACSSLFPTGVGFPGVTFPVNLTLTNQGSLAASDLQVFWDGATCDDVLDPAGTYHGSGELCDQVTISVQETQSNFSTAVACRFPAGPTTCAAAGSLTSFSTTATDAAPLALGSVAPGASRYLKLTFSLPSSAGNSIQGRKASFALTSRLVQ
jgi:hypothetical protein